MSSSTTVNSDWKLNKADIVEVERYAATSASASPTPTSQTWNLDKFTFTQSHVTLYTHEPSDRYETRTRKQRSQAAEK